MGTVRYSCQQQGADSLAFLAFEFQPQTGMSCPWVIGSSNQTRGELSRESKCDDLHMEWLAQPCLPHSSCMGRDCNPLGLRPIEWTTTAKVFASSLPAILSFVPFRA